MNRVIAMAYIITFSIATANYAADIKGKTWNIVFGNEVDSMMVIAINDQDENVDTTCTEPQDYYIFGDLEADSYQIKLVLKESRC